MNAFRFSPNSAVLIIVSITFLTAAAPSQAAGETGAGSDHAVAAQIECITPDGRLTAVLNGVMSNPRPPARLTADNTISCDLQEGETVFIIPVPKTSALDRFSFINLNAAASGEFNIAIAGSRLAPNSPGWVPVDGIVPFSHKRLFNLSLLGTGAKYVKLSFHVEKATRLTFGVKSAETDRARIAVEPPPPAAGPAEN
jgi:hypothetical protein